MSLRRSRPNKRRQDERAPDAKPAPQPQRKSDAAQPELTDEQAKWQQLQQSIGNAAVSRLQAVKHQALAEDATPVDGATQAQIAAQRGDGEALASSARAALEPEFGADLADVRVHTDESSAAMAQGLEARAFTQGRDIFFAPGQYDPASDQGRATIAHELTHALHGSERVGVVHCLGEDIPLPFAPGQRFSEEGPQMSLMDPGGEVSGPAEYGASEGGAVREMVGGVEYAGTTAFEWELGGNVMYVTVPIAFQGEAPNPAWFKEISSVWNHFELVNTDTGERVLLIFIPEESSAGYPVQVVKGTGRSNEGKWFLGDTRTTTAPHEFGHMLGLMDEYQVTAGHYEGITGEEKPVGDDIGGKGTIDEAAGALRAEIGDVTTADQPGRIYQVVLDYGIQQGEFAQAVADSYRETWGELITDLVNIQKTVEDPKGYLYWTIEAFSYSSGSIMGNAEENAKSIDHEHGAQPRHVRRFAQIVARAYGGNWRPEYAL